MPHAAEHQDPVVEAVADPVEADANSGFFQRLMHKHQVAPDAEAPAPDAEASETAAAPEPRRGLLGLFGRKSAPSGPERAEPAALTSEPARSTGLFGGAGSGPDARDAAPGEVLRFGDVARACHVKRGALGREVAKYPERGAKYRVYDSAPGNLGLHTFYITGFDDGCPRQITAALAVFGSAEMYEALRYGLPEKSRSSKPTDKAYEKIKSRVCGVSRNKPCGARMSQVGKDTVFLSLYNRFEGAEGWTNLLLSGGEVVAKDIRG